MNNFLKMLKQLKSKWFYGMLLIYLGIVFMHPEKVQAATENVTLHQYHPDSEFEYSTGALNDYFYEIYPNENQLDYKKFMKYTYKISDDSIIGLEENSYPEAAAIWLGDGDGNLLTVMPYDVTVYALAPGTATLKVYDGSKLVDTFNFTIVADTEYSPSSYVDLTEDEEYDGIQSTETKNYRISKANISEENKLIKQFAKAAANPKYTTTNQRIQAALNAVIGHGSSMISETKYKELDYLASKKISL